MGKGARHPSPHEEELDHVLQGRHRWEQHFGQANCAPAIDRVVQLSVQVQTVGVGCHLGEVVLLLPEELQPT